MGDGNGAPEGVLPGADAARKRAAVETYALHERSLRRTARRYSICDDDADDALQRAFEILLTKAPSEDPRELIRWTQTVLKHEALAVRRERERILSGPAAATPEPGREDWVALIPADADGPPEQAERREAIARSREALQTLKPQELRALGLLAQGYSYREIGEITGYSHTKINRCLAEGRERLRGVLARSHDGSRCEELRPLLSAFCDGEATAADEGVVREHLRACGGCRATLRAYRAAPRTVAALAPGLAVGRSLLERAHEALAELASRLGGGGRPAGLPQAAASTGGGGAGLAGIVKAAALCAGAAGTATACLATGLLPAPAALSRDQARSAAIERRIDPHLAAAWRTATRPGDRPAPTPRPAGAPEGDRPQSPSEPEPASTVEAAPASEAAPTGYPVEPEAEAAPAPTSETPAPQAGGGDPAGEFGP